MKLKMWVEHQYTDPCESTGLTMVPFLSCLKFKLNTGRETQSYLSGIVAKESEIFLKWEGS